MLPEGFGPERGPLLEANLAKTSYNIPKEYKPSVFQRNEETFGCGATKYSLENSVADEAKDARVGARAQASGTQTVHLSAKPGAKSGTYLRKVVPKMGYRCSQRTDGPSSRHSSRRESASRSEHGMRRPLTPTIWGHLPPHFSKRNRHWKSCRG